MIDNECNDNEWDKNERIVSNSDLSIFQFPFFVLSALDDSFRIFGAKFEDIEAL